MAYVLCFWCLLSKVCVSAIGSLNVLELGVVNDAVIAAVLCGFKVVVVGAFEVHLGRVAVGGVTGVLGESV